MDNILLLMASAQIKCALPFQQGTFCYLLYEGEHMSIKKEIDRAVKRIAALDKSTAPKTPMELERIITDVEESYRNAKYDFSNATSMTLSQNGKKRLVKQYDDLYSAENVLCHCIKQILDRVFKIKYPNRNRISRDLFSTLSATIQMSDFTIVRFDFKQYFNSISSIYVFEKYLKNDLLNRYEMDLVKAFVYSTKYAYAGLCTSNAIAEIIAKFFDEAVRQAFISNGLIFYERYVDDCVLILNEHMEEAEVKNILLAILLDVFHDNSLKCLRCRTKYNNQKFHYISRRKILGEKCSLDFLGYEFWLDSNQAKNKEEIVIKYGITQEKRKKYQERLDGLICCFSDPSLPNYNKLELLRHRIAAFSSREVYQTKHFNSVVWRVKGFISNYGQLRYLIDTGLIETSTEDFLKNSIDDAFDRAGIDKPYFLMGGGKLNCGYNLYGNMKSNKTILLVDHIGYDYKSLVNLCKQIGINNIDVNGKRRGYGTLVRDYLIKVRVGY